MELIAHRASGLTPPFLADAGAIASPALVIDAEILDGNISATLALLGDPERWRPHLKTAKLGWTMRRLVERGVRQAKCATPLELDTACAAGFEDVLLAYPAVGPAVEMAREVAARHPGVRISGLVEHPAMVEAWRGSGLGLFVDVNPGMDRTGVPVYRGDEIELLARAILSAGLRFAGFHFYDGHVSGFDPDEAERRVHQGYDRLFALAQQLSAAGLTVEEIVTAGTPAFPHAVAYGRFTEAGMLHRLSPGTVVYNDARSLLQLPESAGYRTAVAVLSRVVSHPTPTRFTCDAGHKTVSADSGDPTCVIVGHPEYLPRHPSEEHLPVDVSAGTPLPERGHTLWLVPQHVCPTVNNFDHAVIVEGGRVVAVERVTARGRTSPVLPEAAPSASKGRTA